MPTRIRPSPAALRPSLTGLMAGGREGPGATASAGLGVRSWWMAFFLVLMAAAPGCAQEAGLEDFAWLTGSWEGPGPEGTVADITFMAPQAGIIPAFFRLRRDTEVVILEVMSLLEGKDTVVMYVRHFDTSLVPLEEEHAIKLVLSAHTTNSFIFRNAYEEENPRRSVLTRTDRGFVSLSELARSDGSTDTIQVEYHRTDPGKVPKPGSR